MTERRQAAPTVKIVDEYCWGQGDFGATNALIEKIQNLTVRF
jgi:hypothetical protein